MSKQRQSSFFILPELKKNLSVGYNKSSINILINTNYHLHLKESNTFNNKNNKYISKELETHNKDIIKYIQDAKNKTEECYNSLYTIVKGNTKKKCDNNSKKLIFSKKYKSNKYNKYIKFANLLNLTTNSKKTDLNSKLLNESIITVKTNTLNNNNFCKSKKSSILDFNDKTSYISNLKSNIKKNMIIRKSSMIKSNVLTQKLIDDILVNNEAIRKRNIQKLVCQTPIENRLEYSNKLPFWKKDYKAFDNYNNNNNIKIKNNNINQSFDINPNLNKHQNTTNKTHNNYSNTTGYKTNTNITNKNKNIVKIYNIFNKELKLNNNLFDADNSALNINNNDCSSNVLNAFKINNINSNLNTCNNLSKKTKSNAKVTFLEQLNINKCKKLETMYKICDLNAKNTLKNEYKLINTSILSELNNSTNKNNKYLSNKSCAFKSSDNLKNNSLFDSNNTKINKDIMKINNNNNNKFKDNCVLNNNNSCISSNNKELECYINKLNNLAKKENIKLNKKTANLINLHSKSNNIIDNCNNTFKESNLISNNLLINSKETINNKNIVKFKNKLKSSIGKNFLSKNEELNIFKFFDNATNLKLNKHINSTKNNNNTNSYYVDISRDQLSIIESDSPSNLSNTKSKSDLNKINEYATSDIIKINNNKKSKNNRLKELGVFVYHAGKNNNKKIYLSTDENNALSQSEAILGLSSENAFRYKDYLENKFSVGIDKHDVFGLKNERRCFNAKERTLIDCKKLIVKDNKCFDKVKSVLEKGIRKKNAIYLNFFKN